MQAEGRRSNTELRCVAQSSQARSRRHALMPTPLLSFSEMPGSMTGSLQRTSAAILDAPSPARSSTAVRKRR